MKPNLYFGGIIAPHFISKFLCKTMFAATLLFSSMLMAQDTEPPEITSGKTGMNLAENSGANQVVYNTVANDNVAVTSYELTGTDADNGPNDYVSFSGTFHEGRFYDGKTFANIWTDGAGGDNTLLDQTMATVVARQTNTGGSSEVSDAVTVQLSQALSIDDHEEGGLFYTNPVTNELQLISSTPIKSLLIYAITGQKVLDITPNNNEAVVDVSSLSQGIYLMKVRTGSTQKTVKLLKR